MALTHNQIQLIRCVAKNNLRGAKEYAYACCMEDTTQKNKGWVTQLLRELEQAQKNEQELPANLKGLLEVYDYTSFNEDIYYVSPQCRQVLDTIYTTSIVCNKFKEKKIPYLNTTLLSGISGVGKTQLVKYVAYKLEKPLYIVKFSSLIDSYLGGTSNKLSQIFDYIRGNDCILFIDELDAIGTARGGNSNDNKEMGRVVITLLQEFDRLNNDCIVVGATNLPDTIDKALMRRFNNHYEITELTKEQGVVLVHKLLDYVDDFISWNEDKREVITRTILMETLVQASIVRIFFDFIKGECIREAIQQGEVADWYKEMKQR